MSGLSQDLEVSISLRESENRGWAKAHITESGNDNSVEDDDLNTYFIGDSFQNDELVRNNNNSRIYVNSYGVTTKHRHVSGFNV